MNKEMSADIWFDAKKASEYIGCNPEVLKRWAREGRLRGRGVGKAGSDWRFKKEALDRHMEFNAKSR